MLKTLFDVIWDGHFVATRSDGLSLIHIDRHVLHDLHAPPAFARLNKSGYAVRRPDLTVAVTDHTVSTLPARNANSSPQSAEFIAATRAGATRHGITLLDLDHPAQGIVHVVTPELGIALPGGTLACPDSHACTVGGLGTLAFATGTTELVHVLATQMLALRRPRQMRIRLDGVLPPHVSAKDLILYLIGHFGSSLARGHAVEFSGAVARALPVEARLTLCNMVTELGGRTGIIAPDDTVFSWLAGRPCTPQGAQWDAALTHWRTLKTDDDAQFDHDLSVDCSKLEPQITWGVDPTHVLPVSGHVPDPAALDANARAPLEQALDYMGLAPGTPLEGVPIDRVFIGSCTNARLSDLEAAAQIVRGRKIAAGIQAAVVPGSSGVKAEAERLGLDRVFVEAGFEWRSSGCSMCAGLNGDEGRAGERIVSTTNRNFAGRQGAGVRTHLASPAMAAAAALAGHITDVRRYSGHSH
ncbi:3-isopropylmalate dehydratase large subunit [Paraburkholderia sp. ZP32-5]|uniref:3-isopropylmalate dehydratase large subunit n=1 Tax=Paraburkholderia sp. ZP32-5 TaxID=2883245 RepID=UPI002DD446B6|nr:3-isopropylmalate dehydratase large subunit [Paraburkholderia sp. ZP32-5]